MSSHSPVAFPAETARESYSNGDLSEFAAPVDSLVTGEKTEEDSEPPLAEVPADSIVHDDVTFSIHDFPFEEAQLSGYSLHIVPNEPTQNSLSEITNETHEEVHNCAPISDAPPDEAARVENLASDIDGCTTDRLETKNNTKPLETVSEFKNFIEGLENVTTSDDGGKPIPHLADRPLDEIPLEEIKVTDGLQRPEFEDTPKPSDTQNFDNVCEDMITPSVQRSSNEANVPSEELKKTDESHEEQAPEFQDIQIPTHWHPKPCVHVRCIGGAMTEEELSSIFSKYGPISSFLFENERHDTALVRYDYHENIDDFLEEVCQSANNIKLEEKTLIVEPFQPDSLLFVGNLTSSIDDASLQEMFTPHGKIERAFVLHNVEGKSKCYGFIEFNSKAEAQAAKLAMGNMKMDGRVLRVEWSDCKKVSDMFSSVLFVDRLPREGSNVDISLRELFGEYGKIRGIHIAAGFGNQYRGFAFVDFYHSSCADKAFQALEGHAFEGSNIRVNFANPSKSAQSYKFTYGSQPSQGYASKVGSAASRGRASPLMHPHFMGSARSGMGYGVSMQYGRGPYDRVPVSQVHASGMGMLGPGVRPSHLYANVASRPRMMVGENNMQRMSLGQAVSITPAAIVQVATAQAKAREEEARFRAEAAKQGFVRSGIPAHLASGDRHQRYPHSSYQFKQSDLSHGYPHAYQPSAHQQAILQQQYPGWNQQQQQQQQQQVSHAAQAQALQYYAQPRQNFPHQQQNEGYYQQTAQQQQQQQQYIQGYPYSQYGQQQMYQQYGQQVNAPQAQAQVMQYAGQQYQQPAQQSQNVYPQQNYEQFVQTQSQQHYAGSANVGASAQDPAQQQAYAAYYQQQDVTQATGTAGASSTAQQNYEAQWAAYYASQAAYQQQTAAADVGQKRTADQMESYQTNQAAYNYAGYSQDGTYQQQQAQQSTHAATAYQQPSDTTTAYQQQATVTANVPYQQQVASGYQQPSSGVAYPAQATAQSVYEQPAPAAAENYSQLSTGTTESVQPAGLQGQASVPDYSKRPRY